MDPELFFPIGAPPASTLAVCRSLCPVREDCLDEALAQGHHGVWGGTTSGERRSMRRSVLLSLTSRAAPEVTPMPEPKSYASEITEALLDGRTVKDVAQAYDRPRQQITALISRTDGWSLDPHTDTVVIGSQHDEPAASADVDLSSHDQPDEDDDFDLTGLERLLHRAEQSETAATRTAAEKARTAVDDLRERVRTEAAEAQIRDEISALEEKLAAARSQLKEIRPGKATARRAPGDGPTSKEVRAWAAEKGIECSPIGRVPQAIVDMYLAAKASA